MTQPSPWREEELVARADVDKNGTVSRDEYLNAVALGERTGLNH